MQAGILLNGSLESNVTYAQTADEVGFDTAFVGELWGADAFVQLAHLANVTDGLNLATGIVNVYSRTPAILAMASHALSEITGGRFSLGLGVSTPTAIENTHGLSYDRPVRRVHEVVEAVRRLHSGDGRVSYDGELVTVTDVPALDADVPIFNAALGSANRRVTGKLCDGWLPHMISFAELDDAFQTVRKHAREAGRDPDDITVAPWIPTAVDEDAETARRHLRGHIAYYGGSSNGYNDAVARMFPDEAAAIFDAWQAGEHDHARDLVTEEMVRELGVAGTPDTVRTQLVDIASAYRVDLPTLVPPKGADEALVERTISAVEPLLSPTVD